ncbi:MAG: ribbon-helix-helix domain-containing protein [archaeon]
MTMQINVRLPNNLLDSAKGYAEERGYGNIQDFIRETIREKIFEEPEISKEELELVKKLVATSEKKNLYGTEEELFKKLRRR